MIKNGFFVCCNKRIQKINDNTNFNSSENGMYFYCSNCKHEHDVIIENGKLKQDIIIFNN